MVINLKLKKSIVVAIVVSLFLILMVSNVMADNVTEEQTSVNIYKDELSTMVCVKSPVADYEKCWDFPYDSYQNHSYNFTVTQNTTDCSVQEQLCTTYSDIKTFLEVNVTRLCSEEIDQTMADHQAWISNTYMFAQAEKNNLTEQISNLNNSLSACWAQSSTWQFKYDTQLNWTASLEQDKRMANSNGTILFIVSLAEFFIILGLILFVYTPIGHKLKTKIEENKRR